MAPYSFAKVSAFILLGTLGFSGCATKKYVRQQVDPVNQRVGTLDQRSQQHASSISNLENEVSRADEHAMDADRKAVKAGELAGQANENATRAGQRADEARQVADRSLASVGNLERQMQNMDNYKQVVDDSVLFRFNRSELDKDAKAKLDQLAQQVQGMRRYVIEIQGHTDKAGNKNYNLQLSQRRADAVIRYLTTQHQVPLRNIHVIGLGSEAPLQQAEGNRREQNKQNRRVEIRVFAPDMQNNNPVQSRNTPSE